MEWEELKGKLNRVMTGWYSDAELADRHSDISEILAEFGRLSSSDFPCIHCDKGWQDMTTVDGEGVVHGCEENCGKLKEWREGGDACVMAARANNKT